MPKFTVVLYTAYMTWEGVEAKDEVDAINQCSYPPEFDANETHTMTAQIEEDEEEDE